MLYVIPNYICSVYVIYLCPINVLILSDLSRVLLPWKRLLLSLLLLLKNLNHIPEIANSNAFRGRAHATVHDDNCTIYKSSYNPAPAGWGLAITISKKENLKFPYMDQPKCDCSPYRAPGCQYVWGFFGQSVWIRYVYAWYFICMSTLRSQV